MLGSQTHQNSCIKGGKGGKKSQAAQAAAGLGQSQLGQGSLLGAHSSHFKGIVTLDSVFQISQPSQPPLPAAAGAAAQTESGVNRAPVGKNFFIRVASHETSL